MKNLRVHEKLSKSQKLMQGRRFRVLKEIDEEINHEVRSRFSRSNDHRNNSMARVLESIGQRKSSRVNA